MEPFDPNVLLSIRSRPPGVAIAIMPLRGSAVARVSEAPPEISRGAPHTLLSYYYELQ